MPTFRAKFSQALRSADEILVTMPGAGQPLRADCDFDVNDTLPDGTAVFYPIVVSLENSPEDLKFDEADVDVNNGVVRINDRQGRQMTVLLNAKRPLGQQDLVASK